jgi:hypothetical protein
LPISRCRASPVRLRGDGCVERCPAVGDAGVGDVRENLTGGGVVDREGLAPARVTPLTTDEQSLRDGLED